MRRIFWVVVAVLIVSLYMSFYLLAAALQCIYLKRYDFAAYYLTVGTCTGLLAYLFSEYRHWDIIQIHAT